MIHDHARVAAIRAGVTERLALLTSLEQSISSGQLDSLTLARHQTGDIETFFLQDLERQDRTPTEEAAWLSSAEAQFRTWDAYLNQTQAQFNKLGDKIQVIGG